jgi:hypothetical protein
VAGSREILVLGMALTIATQGTAFGKEVLSV